MRKPKKRTWILLAILAVWIGMFTTDAIRCQNETAPIFCIETQADTVWVGLFYKVTWHRWANSVCGEGDVEISEGLCDHDKWEMTTWFVYVVYD
jgi:hypothetical protein